MLFTPKGELVVASVLNGSLRVESHNLSAGNESVEDLLKHVKTRTELKKLKDLVKVRSSTGIFVYRLPRLNGMSLAGLYAQVFPS